MITKLNNMKWVKRTMAGVFYCLLISVSCLLSSCSTNDYPVNNNPAGNMHKQQLIGAWYDIYEVEGTTTAKSVTTKNDTVIQIAHVMDVYQFTEAGVGSFRRYYFRDDSFEPIGMTGVTAATYASPFKYTTTQERPMVEGQDMGRARIDMTLINAEVTETPDKWSVTYDDDNICANGLDGQQSVLIPASEELGKIIDSWGGEYAAAAAGAGIIDLEGISTLNWHGLLYLLEPNKQAAIIGAHAFEHCTSLITLTCLDKNVQFGNYAFKDCFELSTVTPYQFNTKIDDTVFEGCDKLIVKPKGK